MSSSDLFLEHHGAISHLVLNRPEKRNALTRAMWQAMPVLLAEAALREELRVLLVRGEGGAFAAGADIGEFEDVYATRESADAFSREVAEALDALAAFPMPVIARIDGPCIGAGCGIALSCDLRFCTPESKFGVTPAKLGLLYPLNDTRRLVDAVGQAMARDILFSARHLDGFEAEAIGLVAACQPTAEMDRLIEKRCSEIAARSAGSLKGLKYILNLVSNGTLSDTAETRALFRDAFDSGDFHEGYRAFLEKRAPDFSGGR
ncbi:enoyl-CoA hydratase-related protein [Hyphobacterium sp. HN65]|uniref:Enoyl-CoA hydratase-related protein n=1 Tax=Hyphobacterium lacteum TaxID=3116575 RepID=A0ABU7LP41_9PROT|nr:enoyl-CoA hydratase-related protein [Hyphobacterium sp. HN65]MEE2525681.1 enoyl-CoA hydratase-related protein [Hyphobacterium sp. HN65]